MFGPQLHKASSGKVSNSKMDITKISLISLTKTIATDVFKSSLNKGIVEDEVY